MGMVERDDGTDGIGDIVLFREQSLPRFYIHDSSERACTYEECSNCFGGYVHTERTTRVSTPTFLEGFSALSTRVVSTLLTKGV